MARRKQKGTASKLAVLAFAIAVPFALAEGCLRLWLEWLAPEAYVVRWGSAAQVERNVNLRYARHHYLPFIPAPGYRNGADRHNGLGFRGEEVSVPKADGIFRIVCLGGSTTYTTGVEDYRQSYPFLLQSVLRQRGLAMVEVVNAGCGRYSSWESLMNLEFRVLDLDPDLVIVYHGVNDVHDRLVGPAEAYRGDNSGSRRPYSRPRETGWDRSVVLRALRTELGWRRPLSGLLYLRTFDWLPTNVTSEFLEQGSDDGTAAALLARNDARYFERNLRNMLAICRANAIEMVLMTFAFSPEFDYPVTSSPEYQQAIAEQNQAIRDLCDEQRIPCLDLAAGMPTDRRFWSDGRHVTIEGARLKAELVAGFLESQGLLPVESVP